MAISDFLKPFRFEGSDTGFVFFGQRLSGTANAVVGPLFGIYLLVYAVTAVGVSSGAAYLLSKRKAVLG